MAALLKRFIHKGVFMKQIQGRTMLGAAALCCMACAPSHAADLAKTAMSSPDFSTLVTAVKAAGLAGALQGKDHLTVFAPTNEAFAKLPAGTLEMLLKPENKETLASIIKYHVVPGRVTAKKVTKLPSGTNVKTLNGEAVAVRLNGGVALDPFLAGKANVTKTDIKASNGVIHVIDTVLIPPTVAKALADKGG
jgi:uncharacterized surface protein with fasciclin (FAS1) repeats